MVRPTCTFSVLAGLWCDADGEDFLQEGSCHQPIKKASQEAFFISSKVASGLAGYAYKDLAVFFGGLVGRQ